MSKRLTTSILAEINKCYFEMRRILLNEKNYTIEIRQENLKQFFKYLECGEKDSYFRIISLYVFLYEMDKVEIVLPDRLCPFQYLTAPAQRIIEYYNEKADHLYEFIDMMSIEDSLIESLNKLKESC